MRILVIGGTVFLGRHFTEAAIEAGHEITLFHRGEHNPDLFPQVERVKGDRRSDLDRLHGTWDVVLDTCAYFPRDVTYSAGLLADRVDRYIIISSLSVYADGFSQPGIDETGRLLTADPDATEIGDDYGGLKALCEARAEEKLPGRTLVIRPGLIVGPFDQSDRFTYWAVRFDRGGDILAPGPPEDPVQLIDVRDLAEWTLRMAESGTVGIFNANGPEYELTMMETLNAGLAAAGNDGHLTWVEGDWLQEQGVKPWMEMPLWVPGAPGFARFDRSKAIAAGLTFRPITSTFEATIAWSRTRDANHEWRAGLAADRERELLEAWKSRQPSATP